MKPETRKTTKRKKRIGGLYTKGELHKVIDAFVHPAAARHAPIWLVDTALHAAIEMDPNLTFQKFLRYTLPKLEKQMLRDLKRNMKRKRST